MLIRKLLNGFKVESSFNLLYLSVLEKNNILSKCIHYTINRGKYLEEQQKPVDVHHISEKIHKSLDKKNKYLSENIKCRNPISPVIYNNEYVDCIAPEIGKSYSIALYANQSKTLQNLVLLGVDLSKVEQTGCADFLLKADFEKDIKEHLVFLHRLGVESHQLGPFITKNPLIFQEDIGNLNVRIQYLKSKKFSKNDISNIITRTPKFLMFSTLDLDKQFGYIQNFFSLKGKEVRNITVKLPRMIISGFQQIRENNFAIRELIGFSVDESKQLLMRTPKLWLISRDALVERFDYYHNVMGITHKQLVLFPTALQCRLFKFQQRHLYLSQLNRAQYDPKKPNYVSLSALVLSTDQDFCATIAHSCVEDYNKFLKTL